MKIEEIKDEALQYCCEIATDYSEEEVKQFAPESVQRAWKLGNDYLEVLIKESRKKRIGMTL